MKMNIVNLFKELRDKYKISFIYITHDLSTAYYVSDYIATLYRGCLIEYGPAKQIMDNPAHPYTELLMSLYPVSETNGKKKLSCRIWKEKNMQWNTVSSHLVVRTQPMNVSETPGCKRYGNGRMVLCCHPLCQQTKEA